MKVHCIDAKAIRDGWFDGKIDKYFFRAKVYDTGSEFGIEGGRVSKLDVWNESSGNPVTNFYYDRGWDTPPTTDEDKSILRALLGFFRWYPTSEYWEELAAEEPFTAKLCLTDGSNVDVRIAVSTNGCGTVLDAPKSIQCRKRLNPVTVWELKMHEKTGQIPRFDTDGIRVA